MQIGDKAQAGGMLYRLVCGPVFAQPNGIMGENMYYPLAHQCCHPQGIEWIIGTSQKGATKRNIAAMQGNAVHDGSHAKLAYPIIDVAPKLHPVLLATHWFGPWPVGKVRAGQVC